MDLLSELQAAADRGVKVTVLTNARRPVPTKLPWRFRETRDAGYGEFKGAGYDVMVMDSDGDLSWWRIKKDGIVIARGETLYDGGDYYHFDACLLDAELVLKAIVRARFEALRRKSVRAYLRTKGLIPCWGSKS